MTKVVVDTNVFLSGLLFGGVPEQILTKWSQQRFILCLSPALKAEIINKLSLKFKATDEFLQSINQVLEVHSEKYIPQKRVTICKDPTDNFLLELAEESQADFLISGDKLVLRMKTYKQTKIVSPKVFLVEFDT